jgi:hypothetical protein
MMINPTALKNTDLDLKPVERGRQGGEPRAGQGHRV